jgi:hypothetical protein
MWGYSAVYKKLRREKKTQQLQKKIQVHCEHNQFKNFVIS